MKNSKRRYKFYVSENKVVCVSSYAGKVVRGIAKCAPEDMFDLEVGKKLAQTRCDYKIAQKRAMWTKSKLYEARKAITDAIEHKEAIENYYYRSLSDFDKLGNELTMLENELYE